MILEEALTPATNCDIPVLCDFINIFPPEFQRFHVLINRRTEQKALIFPKDSRYSHALCAVPKDLLTPSHAPRSGEEWPARQLRISREKMEDAKAEKACSQKH